MKKDTVPLTCVCDKVERLNEASAPTHKGKEHKLTHMGNILLALPGA